VEWYEVVCDSQESIHNHNAYAYARGGGPKGSPGGGGAWSLR
jgi:hypothetical protein